MKSTNIISIFLQYYSKKKPTKKQYEYINFLKEKLTQGSYKSCCRLFSGSVYSYKNNLVGISLILLCVIGSIVVLLSAVFISPWFLLFPAVYLLLLFADALLKTRSFPIAGLSVAASLIQIFGYGLGFIRSFVDKIIFRHGLEDLETLKRVYK